MIDLLNRFIWIFGIHGNLIVCLFCLLIIYDKVKMFGGLREFIEYVSKIEDGCEGDGQ